MMKAEFEALTGFYPNASLYSHIEKSYMESGLSKEVFCRNYVENKDGLAAGIRRASDMTAYKEEEAVAVARENLEGHIKRLKKELESRDRELEELKRWEPYECSRMTTDSYARLAAAGMEMGENAREWISDEFGFRPDRITVLEEIPKYERSEITHRIRRTGTAHRPPVYSSTDWNYVRFNISTKGGTFQYEIVNGALYDFSD